MISEERNSVSAVRFKQIENTLSLALPEVSENSLLGLTEIYTRKMSLKN